MSKKVEFTVMKSWNVRGIRSPDDVNGIEASVLSRFKEQVVEATEEDDSQPVYDVHVAAGPVNAKDVDKPDVVRVIHSYLITAHIDEDAYEDDVIEPEALGNYLRGVTDMDVGDKQLVVYPGHKTEVRESLPPKRLG